MAPKKPTVKTKLQQKADKSNKILTGPKGSKPQSTTNARLMKQGDKTKIGSQNVTVKPSFPVRSGPEGTMKRTRFQNPSRGGSTTKSQTVGGGGKNLFGGAGSKANAKAATSQAAPKPEFKTTRTPFSGAGSTTKQQARSAPKTVKLPAAFNAKPVTKVGGQSAPARNPASPYKPGAVRGGRERLPLVPKPKASSAAVSTLRQQAQAQGKAAVKAAQTRRGARTAMSNMSNTLANKGSIRAGRPVGGPGRGAVGGAIEQVASSVLGPLARKAGTKLGNALKPVGRAIDDRLPGINSRDELKRKTAATKAANAKGPQQGPRLAATRRAFSKKTFDQAFKAARTAKAKTFEWRGNKYNTKLRGEK